MAPRRRFLIKGLRIWLDFILIISGLAFSLLLVVGIATSFEEADQSDWTVSVPVALGEGVLKPILPLSPLPGGTPGATEMSLVDGRGELRFDTSDSMLYLGGVLSGLLGGAIAWWALFLLRRILRTTERGDPFNRRNVGDLMLIGWILVLLGSAGPFLERAWVSRVLEQVGPLGLHLSFPPLGVHVDALVGGLLVMVLAGVWREAAGKAEEQSLTV